MPARPARISSAGQLALELPLELPPIDLAPEWKDQQRLWGHAFHPMCSYLASFPAALTHAFIARYSRPGDVVLDPFSGRGTTPLQACAEGRVGVGNDLNPFAHLLTAAKVEPATRAQALTRLAALRLGWNAESAGWLALGERVIATHGGPERPCPVAGSGGSPADGVEAVPVEVAMAFHPRTLAQLLFVRTIASPRRSDGPIPGRRPDRDPPRQERQLSLGADAEHVLDGAALRPRLRRADSVRVARSGRLRRPGQEARPAVPPGAAVDRGDRPARRRAGRGAACAGGPAGARAARSGAAGRDLAAVPARREVRLLQLAPDVVARLRRAAPSTRRSTTPTTASRISCSCATSSPVSGRCSPTTPSSSWSSATSRPTVDGRSGAGSASPSGSGSPPPSPRATAWRGSRSTTSRRSRKMTKLWGDEAGRATKTDRILVLGATEAGRRRALAGARLDVDWTWPPRGLRSL